MFEKDDWFNFEYLKMAYGQGIEYSDEGIQRASNLKHSGTVELALSGSKDLVWLSAEDFCKYSTYCSIDVNSDVDSMEKFSYLLLNIQLDDKEKDSSQSKSFENVFWDLTTCCKT